MKKLILMGILASLPIWGVTIAFIDSQKVFDIHPGAEKAKKELSKEIERERQKLKIMENEILLLQEELKKSISEDARRKKEAIIQVKMEELQKYQTEAVSKISEKKAKLEEKIKLDINNAIKKISEEKKIDIVLDKAVIVYGKPAYDITTGVIKRLGVKVPAKK